MTEDNITTVDRAVMLAGGALVLIAMPILGILVTLSGSMSPMVAWAKGDSSGHALAASGIPDGAHVVSSPFIGPNARAALVVLAVVLFGLLALYKVAQLRAEPTSTAVGTSSEH